MFPPPLDSEIQTNKDTSDSGQIILRYEAMEARQNWRFVVETGEVVTNSLGKFSSGVKKVFLVCDALVSKVIVKLILKRIDSPKKN